MPAMQALDRRGRQLLRQNRIPAALQSFRLATVIEPENPEAWRNYGVVLERNHELGEAIEALEQSIALAPRRTDAWLALGLTRARLGSLDAAEVAYRKVLELDPRSAIAWQCLGLLQETLRRYDEAIACFRTCIARGGATASLWANLAKILQQTGSTAESCEAYAEAVRLDGGNPHFRALLRQCRFRRDLCAGHPIAQALAAYQTAESVSVPNERELQGLFSNTFAILVGSGRRAEAIRLGREYLRRWPGSVSMEYLLQAAEGAAGLDRSPPAYVAEHFDAFAAGFDAQLVGVLGYDIPAQLCAAARSAAAPGRRYDALDAGCGTGLCGPHLLPLARTLTGVDLSPRMLELAENRGVYGELACQDLTPFLAAAPGRFDLVVAADVLIYLGNLAPFFAAASAGIRPGGLLAFSIETAGQEDFRLLACGRFAHSVSYVRRLAAAAFEEETCLDATLRWEGAARVPGRIFVLRRRSDCD